MKNLLKYYLTVLFLSLLGYQAAAQSYVALTSGSGNFPLSVSGKSVPLCVDTNDYAGVIIAIKNLQTDIYKVTQAKPLLITGKVTGGRVVLAGTMGKSALIDGLVASKKLNLGSIAGKWETYIIQTVKNPMPGVAEALVIAGSDKRGTIFGIYDLSAQIGVSPWYYWADVPVKQHKSLYITPGVHTAGTPAVKYRGIFINDEAPAFSGWTKEKFGGVNHLAYEKVFELILRLKGNYLWPAMWGNAFNDDDKMNPVLADEYGVVMGTSHHEPMDRAQQEWKRYGNNIWNYETNAKALQEFWRKGIQNMGTKETIVTMGMRGDGDMAMTEGSNVALLEKIVKDQREILTEVTKKDASKTPQLWALYKEVQDYYDKGMRVPDDITLLLCDDNWGNIRKLPKVSDSPRGGGYGIYYHFDYVGDPRNYKWLNTNPISKVYEQMHLAYEYGANNIWIVNVGDIKPMEFPISFFLDYAWSPKKWIASNLQSYTAKWAAQQFGQQYANDIADMISEYSKYNGRRKPELLNQPTYNLINYNEFETVVTNYNKLAERAERINQKIAPQYKDAYFELVLHPIKACANLNELFYTVAKNRLYAQQGRAATNDLATRAADLFKKDAEISAYYNHTLADGKWNHMMDQTHISYTSWQQPNTDILPKVEQLSVPAKAEMAIAVEGRQTYWPLDKEAVTMQPFNPYTHPQQYIDVFNRGAATFTFKTKTLPYIKILPASGSIDKEQRLTVSVNWKTAPAGLKNVPITITSSNGEVVIINAPVNNSKITNKGFTEADGYVAIEAGHYTKAVNNALINWQVIPDYGRTLAGVTTFPVTAAPVEKPGDNTPHLEYTINLTSTGSFNLTTYVSPTLDFTNTDGLKFGISIDDETPQVINLQADKSPRAWQAGVANNIKMLKSAHKILNPGKHTIKYWMINSGVVLQRLVLDCGGVKPSYLGPPESYFKK